MYVAVPDKNGGCFPVMLIVPGRTSIPLNKCFLSLRAHYMAIDYGFISLNDIRKILNPYMQQNERVEMSSQYSIFSGASLACLQPFAANLGVAARNKRDQLVRQYQ